MLLSCAPYTYSILSLYRRHSCTNRVMNLKSSPLYQSQLTASQLSLTQLWVLKVWEIWILCKILKEGKRLLTHIPPKFVFRLAEIKFWNFVKFQLRLGIFSCWFIHNFSVVLLLYWVVKDNQLRSTLIFESTCTVYWN